MAWCIAIWSDSSASSTGEFIHAIRALIASAFIDIVVRPPLLIFG